MKDQPRSYKKLWLALFSVIALSFLALGYYGREIYHLAPPIPQRVVTTDGTVLFTGQDIKDGQNVWQSIGGEEVGTIWGHGAYVAPDWSADWLHRECVTILDNWAAADSGKTYDQLDAEKQAALRERLKREIRPNTYNAQTGDLVISTTRAEAIQVVGAHYTGVFGDDPAFKSLRNSYAIPANSIKTPERQRLMNAFFFWAAWSCGTERPGSAVTYSQNWPHEALIDNNPTSAIVLWSIVSFIALLGGIGAMVWYNARQRHIEDDENVVPQRDPLLGIVMTPSMHATLKYFWIVVALIVVQVGLGAVTAHYGVEGDGFFGIPLAQMAAVCRRAHLAHAAWHFLDCDRVAGHGPVRRARRFRQGTRRPAFRREFSFHLFAHHCRRLARR